MNDNKTINEIPAKDRRDSLVVQKRIIGPKRMETRNNILAY